MLSPSMSACSHRMDLLLVSVICSSLWPAHFSTAFLCSCLHPVSTVNVIISLSCPNPLPHSILFQLALITHVTRRVHWDSQLELIRSPSVCAYLTQDWLRTLRSSTLVWRYQQHLLTLVLSKTHLTMPQSSLQTMTVSVAPIHCTTVHTTRTFCTCTNVCRSFPAQ